MADVPPATWHRVPCVVCYKPTLSHATTPREHQVCEDCARAVTALVIEKRRAVLSERWLIEAPVWLADS